MKLFKKVEVKKISELETIEQKSFWIVAPIVIVVGIISLTTLGSYSSPWPILFASVFCLILPLLLIFFVYKKKNYHTAYPLLCISSGAIAVPITLVYCGGLLSSMPLFCVVTTGITVLCYSPKFRYISFLACMMGNSLAFLFLYNNITPFPLAGSEQLYENFQALHPVYKDMIGGYYVASLALFIAVHFVVNDIRRYKINQDALQQFFDKEKRKEILNQVIGDNVSIGSQQRKAVIIFADISNFTTITEKMEPTLISKFLNEFFSLAGEEIHATGGIIDKFIGDCIMAYWYDSGEGNCVLNAIQAMINLKLSLLKKAEAIYKEYETELNFSVGMAYGDVIFGDIGSNTMHDYTVIGDAVNTASRIESYAVSGEMLISDSAAKMVKGAVILEAVESDHFFKGKNKPIDLYRIIGLATEKQVAEFPSHETAGYDVHVCGCRGSFPVSGLRFSEYGGETSCYVVKKDDYAVVVDCGTGLKNAVKLLNDCKKIDILLTHVHYDHILGLLMSRFPKDAKIRIFGNFKAWGNNSNTLEGFMEHPYWPVEINDIEKNVVELGKELKLNDDLGVTFYPSDHPDNACVIKLMCKDKKVVFLFDCEDANAIPDEVSRNSDLLFFDGMFDDNDTVDHKGWGHGTWQDGVKFFNEKNIKKLVITHHNPELGDHSLMLKEVEARKENANISFAKSGDAFII